MAELLENDQSWVEYRRLVLGELERLSNRIEQTCVKHDAAVAAIIQRIDLLQSTQISDLRIEMAALKTKSGAFGAMMGALTGIAIAIGGVLMQHWH